MDNTSAQATVMVESYHFTSQSGPERLLIVGREAFCSCKRVHKQFSTAHGL